VLRPSLQHERVVWRAQHLLVGVDEAGRGPLAGPVVAAAVVFPPGSGPVRGLRDSKMLPALVRERLAQKIRTRVLGYAVGAASAREIDRLNIRVATALAMRRAIARLLRLAPVALLPLVADCPPPPNSQLGICRILIDGLPLPEIGYPHEALIDGDARCVSIAAAAILAKVTRDCLMHRLAPRYPAYHWDTNVGYGTPEHHDGLRERGPCRHHRQSFAPIAQIPLPL
jgi:ribonuclease HII